ncbi:MAG TPA: YceI family protein [Pyrinomonadaceae bacterium]|nr:YceI family protein [Pyrinomonadaceae bacterium]
MDRSKTSVLLLVCAALLVAVSFSLPVADAQEKPAGVSFETIPTGDYRVDPGHSVIGFSIRHFEISFVRGRFKDFTSTIHYDAADMTKSTVEFTAKVESIDTGVGGRDNHLRSADFFDVAQFPEMKFKSTKVEKKGNGYVLHGDFTLKGVTKPISFPFNLTGAIKDNRGNMRFGVAAETKINRRDYGITWGAKMANGGLNVADEVLIDLQLEAVKPAAPAAAQ